MKIAAVVCEYNPFHNGHKYQIEQTKREIDAFAVIGVMSGDFTQRGELSPYSKYTRAKCAVLGGCDLVLELPVFYSLSSAKDFAGGAVDIAAVTGVVDFLSFGSECGSVEKLWQTAQVMNTDNYNEKMRELLSRGLSYPAAVHRAFLEIGAAEQGNIISSPNNILAVEYLNALKVTDIKPFTVKRQKSSHDSTAPVEEFASAAYIRQLIREESDYSKYIPAAVSAVLRSHKNEIRDIEKFEFSMLCALKLMSFSDIIEPNGSFGSYKNGIRRFSESKAWHNNIMCAMGEGLENKLIRLLPDINSFEELVSALKTKRYTMARLRRSLLKIYLGISSPPPLYIRVLAFNDKGRTVLKMMKKTALAPIVLKPADTRKLNPAIENHFAQTARITSMLNMVSSRKINEYRMTPFYNGSPQP